MHKLFQSSILGGVRVGINEPVRLIGVINLSPESFYRGSVVEGVDSAFRLAVDMVEAGADIIDVGGMSTAPYKETYISEEEEVRRVKSVVKELANSLEVPISIDTRRSSVAEVAVGNGAVIINDTSGLRHDPNLARVAKEHDVSLILMAYGDTEDNLDPIQNIRRLLRESLDKALSYGVEQNKIVIDPGIGFFRDRGIPWYDWDTYVLRNLYRLHILGKPILVGVSRKSFIGAILRQKDPGERLYGSLASEAIAVYNGASAIRTHNIKESIQAVKLAEYVRPRMRIINMDSGLMAIDLDNLFNHLDLKELLSGIDVDPVGADIMSIKGDFKVIYLSGVPRLLALVLKQEMLSVGGEVATPRDTIFSGFKLTDVVLMGTIKHYKILIEKLGRMDFKSISERGLPNSKEVIHILRQILNQNI